MSNIIKYNVKTVVNSNDKSKEEIINNFNKKLLNLIIVLEMKNKYSNYQI